MSAKYTYSDKSELQNKSGHGTKFIVFCNTFDRFLDFSDNLLSDLPEDIAQLHNLESLILVFNRIDKLPESICDMVNLHVLWLGRQDLFWIFTTKCANR